MKYLIIKALLVAATSLDAHSSHTATSMGYREVNPLFSSNGQYRAKGIALEFSLTGGALFVDYLQTRHHPERRKRIAFTELGLAGSKFAVAGHNYYLISK